MSDQTDKWSVYHFSLTNPVGPGHSDVPRFLRHLADTIEERGNIEIQDIVFVREMDEDGENFPRATVYYHRAAANDGEPG